MSVDEPHDTAIRGMKVCQTSTDNSNTTAQHIYSMQTLATLKGHSSTELHTFLVHIESIYYHMLFYSKTVLKCGVTE